MHAKAFDQKTPERLHKSRAIMQSNAVNTFSICAAQTREEPSMKIGIGNDHAAVGLKNIISEHLKERGCEVVNFGTDTSESFDYPIAGYKVGKAVANGDVDLGILICGTGVGISMAANKVRGVRAANCADTFSARMTRLHNDANVLCLGSRVIGAGLALDMVDLFVDTPFSGEERHQRRIDQVMAIENEKFSK